MGLELLLYHIFLQTERTSGAKIYHLCVSILDTLTIQHFLHTFDIGINIACPNRYNDIGFSIL